MLSTILLAVAFQAATPGGSYTQSLTKPDGTFEMRTRAQHLVAEGKPDIWLVGAVHVGTAAYYSQIQSLLNAQGTVLYEGVKQEGASLKPMKPNPNDPKPVYKVLSDAIGLDFQLNDIDYNHANWSDTDLTWQKIMELNKKEAKGKPDQVDTIASLLDPNGKTAKLFSTMIGSATPGMREAFKILMVKIVASGKGPTLDPTTSDIVVTARNQVVLDRLATLIKGPNPPKSIAVFFGAIHQPGLEKSLVATDGYKEADQKWYTSATADPKKLDAGGKQILAAFDKMTTGQKMPPPSTGS